MLSDCIDEFAIQRPASSCERKRCAALWEAVIHENHLLMKARRVLFGHSRIDLIAKRSSKRQVRCGWPLPLREIPKN
jgi:hypothetical protein